MVADPLQARAVALAEGEVAALLVVLSVAFSAPLRLAVHVVNAGWIGHCRTAVQDSLGAPAVVVSGALGDVNPPGGDGYDRSGGGVALAREVGTAVAALAVRAADRTAAVGDGLVLRHRTAVERPGPVLPVGLAPTWQGYLPHPDAMTGGYEIDIGLGAPSLLDALAALAPA